MLPFSLARMATLLFKLRNVPDDEAEDIRELLNKNNIDYYETTSGSWGISLPALWLHNKTQLKEARAYIAKYQAERTKRAQAAYQQQCIKGEQRTIFTLIRENPLKCFAYIFAIFFVLYLATIPVSFLFHHH
jgi:hypothetical protein